MSILALALGVMPVTQSATMNIARAEQTRLNDCIALTESDPEAAHEESLRWLGEGARPAARYCNALAIMALGNYQEGAARLEELANAPDAGSMSDRAIYLAQSGNAWLTAGYPDAAITTLTNAIKLAPEDSGILADRGAAYLALGKWDQALGDLNTSLGVQPAQVDVLQMRARAYLNLERYEDAEADMERALDLDGRNIDTLVLRGDIREARRVAGE